MKKLLKSLLVTLFTLSVMGTLSCFTVSAANLSSTVPLSVRIDDSSHISKQKAYYQIQANQARDFPIAISVTNMSKTNSCQVSTRVDVASTSSKLALFYDNDQSKLEKLPFNMRKLVTFANGSDRNFQLNPGQTRNVKMSLNLDNDQFKNFNGEILGAVTFTQDAPTVKGEINNQFSYTIPIQVKKGKVPTGEVEKTSASLKRPAIQHSMLMFGLANPKPAMLNNVKANVSLKNTTLNQTITKTSIKCGQIAPNSQFTVKQPLNKQLLPGKYIATINLNGKDPVDEAPSNVELRKEFTINPVDYVRTFSYQTVLIFVGIVMIMLIIIVGLTFLIIRNHCKNKL
ncbi:cell surface protein precursor [Fructilactobacillus fructivorans]|uniref:WxL protein host-binding domain-containing protein n=1 Tax=Fructilactobacillus fructivorans TaxID=1614 RepID=UPI0007050B14|nr:DUF3324 domain-containing protein [Fructilactobacillus fructivorans]KRN12081.1 cell surface protein precursor [Fructilactobacillus fructivorans]